MKSVNLIRKLMSLPMLIAVLLLAISCAPKTPNEANPSLTIIQSSDTQIPPGVNDIDTLVIGNSDFALALYQALKNTDSNIFYSPYSISTALAMTYAGARGKTAEEMADTLGFTLPSERLHKTYNALAEELSKRGKGADLYIMQPEGEPAKETVEGFRLNIVNALWGQEGYKFLDEYINLVEKYYDGNLKSLDFINNPEPSRLEINDWASEQTEGRINDVLPAGSINPLTRLVLTNAIYFKARWEHGFSPKATKDDTFYLLTNETVTVPMMNQKAKLYYAVKDNVQAVRLPYLGGDIAMTILLPPESEFTTFESSFNAKKLASIIEDMELREVRLTLPKFKLEDDYRLDKKLSEMGMPDAFSQGAADFSGMTGKKDMFIGTAIHKTFISIDEVGTEAAAVTAIGMVGAAPPPVPVDVVVNHPFIFLIQDIKTGTILFAGRVLNPADN
jgi:serpin B